LGTKYLIPKQADNLTASIWYKVYEGNTLIDDHSADSVKVTLPVKNVWGINKNVVYALTIDIKGNLIEFSPVILEDWGPETEIPSITVNPASVPELSVGDDVTLRARVRSLDATLKTVVWSSSDTLIATVNPSTGVVTGVAAGTVIITATATFQDGSRVTGTRQVTVVNPDAVDLGLSVKWATWNVGASLPQGYGDHFAWGETETKSDYSWSTYFDSIDGSSSSFRKYYNGEGGKTVLELEDDVAHVKWGGSWRMPTDAEWKELLDNCAWTWTTVGGVNGRLVTSNKAGYTDKSIFLPAAGYSSKNSLNQVGSGGYYWSSSLDAKNSNTACNMYFCSNDDYVYRTSGGRCTGQSVRPVSE